MDDDQQFCLRWNNHQSTILSVFDTLLENETLVDCTLAAEGKFLKAHKVVLSACSPYFATLLSQQYDKHPIFILKDVKFQELRSMMEYMYRGEVNISQDQLAALLKAAESLQIKGLSDSRGGSNNSTNLPSQAHLKGDGKSSHVPAPKASGLTTENKRPQRTDFHPDVSGSREGSISPSTRKRKKVNQRRKSLAESNSLLDNHDQHSNSSSHSNNQQQQPQLSTSATSAPSNMSVTNKKTEHDSNQQDHHEDNGDDEQVHISKRSKHDNADNKQESELMIEPKNEYDDDDDEDGNVEDLTMDDEMLEDLDQAGPSHGGEGSSQGYHWQMDGRSQESQEAAGQHRDAQGTKSSYRLKLRDSTKPQQSSAKYDMNDCLLESENFQITKSDNNKYLLLPVKKQPAEKFVLKECELVPVAKRQPQKQTTKVEKAANVSIQKVPEQTSTPIAEEKKIVKTNHPRIKYSRHKNPTFIGTPPHQQQLIQVQPTVQPVRTTQVLSDGKKIEYISVTTVKPAEPIAKPIILPASNSTQQYVIQAVPTSVSQQGTEYEVSATNTSNQSNDFPNEMMDDLEYGIDDIELPEDVQIHFSDSYKSEDNENSTHDSAGVKKYYAAVSDNSMASDGEEAGRQYECRQCGKRYRWKSTLRRHENVECGGKEAFHQCPYCSYKAKQRGNLGVHIRKHHGDKPPLETRRSKKGGVQTR